MSGGELLVERIEAALTALREGRPVLVTDAADRENEGDVILAAQTLTDEWMAWTIRHTSGYLCAPMTAERADRLELPLMVAGNQDPLRTAYTISVDAASGVSTGISAGDRARTVRVLADPAAGPADLIRPGHVLPLRAREGGVLTRPGHTEAAVDLCLLAGLEPVGVIGELVHDDGTMMRHDAVQELAATHDVPTLTIAELVDARRRLGLGRVSRGASAMLPTRFGVFTITEFTDLVTGAEHVALRAPGSARDGGAPVVRVHSECLTGDTFGSLRCDCGPQLDAAIEAVARFGGAVIYLRGHEGRGVGIAHKIAAYAEQDAGADTVDAQIALGLPIDAREYGAAVAIARELRLTAIRLLSNNPEKLDALQAGGIATERVAWWKGAGPENRDYLATKTTRMGHLGVIA